MKEIFIRTELQRQWLDKLALLQDQITGSAATVDELSIFPKESFSLLREIGYPAITLPKEFGGEGFSVYDMVLLQETLASYDENTSLSMGWTLGVVGELYQEKLWSDDKLNFFANEVQNGAIVNRSVSEARTGSPTRGGRPGTTAVRSEIGWLINGRKIFTTASLF